MNPATSMSVDLSLAINYVPACGCLLRLLCFLIIVYGIHPGQEIGGYTILAALMYVDRVTAPLVIFDTNAVLVSVLLSLLHGVIRACQTGPAAHAVEGALGLFWSLACTGMILNPPALRQFCDRQALLERLGPTLLMLLVVVYTSFIHADREPFAIQAWRSVGFSLLCFAWVYLVGLQDAQGVEHLRTNSYRFVVRNAPMLYAPRWCTYVFFLMACLGLAVQYCHRFRPQILPQCAVFDTGYTRLHTLETIIEIDSSSEKDSDDTPDNLEELLRQARQKHARP